MPTIKVLAGAGFVAQEVRAETICELREELTISSSASVAVNGSNKGNSYITIITQNYNIIFQMLEVLY